MKPILCTIALLLCSPAASAQWVAPNIYVQPGMGYGAGVPCNPYQNYYEPRANYGFVPLHGGINYQRIGNVEFYTGYGAAQGYRGQVLHFGSGYSQGNFHFYGNRGGFGW